MSLIDKYAHVCVKMVGTRTSDDEGGSSVSWSEGEIFRASITSVSGTERTRGEREDSREVYSVFVSRSVFLGYHDVFKRLSDGAVFRVIEDGAEKVTPASATLDIRRVTAERWELT